MIARLLHYTSLLDQFYSVLNIMGSPSQYKPSFDLSLHKYFALLFNTWILSPLIRWHMNLNSILINKYILYIILTSNSYSTHKEQFLINNYLPS